MGHQGSIPVRASAVAALRSLPRPALAPVLAFRLHPKISLLTCEWCNGSGRYVAGWKSFPCTQCAGTGSITTDNGGAA